VHRSEAGTLGLIVDRILNIIDQPADSTEHSLGDQVRAVVVDGKVTDLIDVQRLIEDAGKESTEPISSR
jgi:hypothetical protein